MSYDPACDDLARHFLNGTQADEVNIAALAQVIQDAIQDWLTDFEDDLRDIASMSAPLPPKRGEP
jgi:hypothetical protein